MTGRGVRVFFCSTANLFVWLSQFVVLPGLHVACSSRLVQQVARGCCSWALADNAVSSLCRYVFVMVVVGGGGGGGGGIAVIVVIWLGGCRVQNCVSAVVCLVQSEVVGQRGLQGATRRATPRAQDGAHSKVQGVILSVILCNWQLSCKFMTTLGICSNQTQTVAQILGAPIFSHYVPS